MGRTDLSATLSLECRTPLEPILTRYVQMDGNAPVETVDEMPKLIQTALRTQASPLNDLSDNLT